MCMVSSAKPRPCKAPPPPPPFSLTISFHYWVTHPPHAWLGWVGATPHPPTPHPHPPTPHPHHSPPHPCSPHPGSTTVIRYRTSIECCAQRQIYLSCAGRSNDPHDHQTAVRRDPTDSDTSRRSFMIVPVTTWRLRTYASENSLGEHAHVWV